VVEFCEYCDEPRDSTIKGNFLSIKVTLNDLKKSLHHCVSYYGITALGLECIILTSTWICVYLHSVS
jgi:hypothetical protein